MWWLQIVMVAITLGVLSLYIQLKDIQGRSHIESEAHSSYSLPRSAYDRTYPP